MDPTIETYTCYRINAPELYTDELLAYVQAHAYEGMGIACWHYAENGFDESSDLFLTIDGEEGSNSDMPGWNKIVELAKTIDRSPDGIVWLSNIRE